MRARFFRTLTSPLLACLLACASHAPAGPRSPGPALQQAEVFATAPLSEPLHGDAVGAELAASFERATRDAQLVGDGRLAALAEAIARESEGARLPPSYPLVSFHARRMGLAEPTPQVWLASGPSAETLLPALERAVADASRVSRLTHAGAAALRVDGGVVMALAMSTRAFTLRRPVPRTVAVGADVRLDVELAEGYRAPTLALTSPEGRVSREALGSAPHFQYTLRPDQKGEYTLELLASGPQGLAVIAILPVMVGQPLVTTPPAREPAQVESDAQAVTARLYRLIDQERAERKLPPLKRDARLTRIALAHSEDMVEHDFIAHTSERSGDATARVRRAGLKARLVLENIGRGYSASELHRGLMESPGHRGNILHPDARQLGIGVVAEREGDRYAFIATELFTQLE